MQRFGIGLPLEKKELIIIGFTLGLPPFQNKNLHEQIQDIYFLNDERR